MQRLTGSGDFHQGRVIEHFFLSNTTDIFESISSEFGHLNSIYATCSCNCGYHDLAIFVTTDPPVAGVLLGNVRASHLIIQRFVVEACNFYVSMGLLVHVPFALQADLQHMEMKKPFIGALRRVYNPSLWVQYRQSQHHKYFHARVHRLQVNYEKWASTIQ